MRIGQARTRFKVNTDGSIEVTTRKADDELTLAFENAEALQAQRPELYEKYQDLTSDSE